MSVSAGHAELQAAHAGPRIQVARTDAADFSELHLCARPGRLDANFKDQASAMYRSLLEEIGRQGARIEDIVTEKIFLSDLRAQFPEIRSIRRRALGGESALLPATTYLQQPPAFRGQLCELQAYAMIGGEGPSVIHRSLDGLTGDASGRLVVAGDFRHLFLANVTGGRAGDGLPFRGQADAMFLSAEEILRREGFSFRNVVRTWLYLDPIDRYYSELNQARRAFFTLQCVEPCPASTGIQGRVAPPDRACGLELRALSGTGFHGIRRLHASTMNEAPTYGADFSRGMRVTTGHSDVIYVSGTASIDAAGQAVHMGDLPGQAGRMLLNVEILLAQQGAAFRHVVAAIVYLKRPEDLPLMLEAMERSGFPLEIPATFCVADVCRPEWLCEMEAIAVLT